MMDLVQRSNAPFVKSNVLLIAQKCIDMDMDAMEVDEVEEQVRIRGGLSSSSTSAASPALLVVEPPVNEIRVILECASDPYYQVVLAKCGAIPIIITAMKKFLSRLPMMQQQQQRQQDGCCPSRGTTTTTTTAVAVAAFTTITCTFLSTCSYTLYKLCQNNNTHNYQLIVQAGGPQVIQEAYAAAAAVAATSSIFIDNEVHVQQQQQREVVADYFFR